MRRVISLTLRKLQIAEQEEPSLFVRLAEHGFLQNQLTTNLDVLESGLERWTSGIP